MVPHWERGQEEAAYKPKKMGTVELNVCIGNSIGTGPEGVTAMVEVKNFADLKRLGEKNIKGKIVFFNRPMDLTQIQTFSAYGGAVNQRGGGAVKQRKYGALGVIIAFDRLTRSIIRIPVISDMLRMFLKFQRSR